MNEDLTTDELLAELETRADSSLVLLLQTLGARYSGYLSSSEINATMLKVLACLVGEMSALSPANQDEVFETAWALASEKFATVERKEVSPGLGKDIDPNDLATMKIMGNC
jgi:hypothetical protein